ncbi:ABC transporter B family member 11 [Platanthera guangdongensis]|uniref:ABC transporter B family member 11 n=1 Tax=Platanthera guangdongensis TaxID=2320717 RepID=A0ABR2MUR2_9ASPA
MKSIIRQDIAFYDNETTTGQVIASLSGDIILTQDAIGEKVGKFIHLISMFFGGFVIAIIRGWRLALVLMACIPFIAITGAVMSMLTLRFSVKGQLRHAEVGSMIEETVGSIRTVASFSGESQAMKTYDKLIRSTYKSAVLEGVANGLGIGAILMFSFCSYGLAIWYSSELVIHNGYTGGVVVNVMLAIMTGSMSLGQASPCVRAFSAGQVATHKIFEVIRRKSAIDIYDMSGTVLEDMKGEIELRDVYFSYPTRPDQMIFRGFSLQVRSGMTMALIGESGSGKSTVISLVERFYDPQAGEVLIDGFNLKNLRLSWIRKKISLVSQEPVMFMTTIKDNIMYGKEDASAEEISRALNLANADKFISNMPYGLETMVGEHGTQISGGQKQRIAIARAILRNPKILLLDEATSALDLKSESIVHDALLNIMTDRTTIIVAHRLTTVKNADTISVLHKGRLVEQGSHSELIENVGGAYSQMVRLQDLTNEGEAEPSPSMNEMSQLKAIQKPATSHDHGHLKQRSMSGGSSSRRTFSLRFLFRSSNEVESCGDDSRGINVGYNAENEEKKGAFILRLILLNKPEILTLLAGTTAAAVNGVIFPLYGILLSSAIKTFYEPPHQLRKDAKFWALMHVVLGAVGFFVIPWQHYCFGVAGGRLVERVRSLLFQRTVHQEISWFDDPENSSGAIGARLSRDASLLRNLVGDTLSFMVQNSSTVICGLAVAFAANWKLAFVILASIPLVGLQAYVQVKFLRGFSADAKMLYEDATQVASEAVGGIRTVASFCAEEKVMIAYGRKCDLPMRHGIQKGLISGLGYGFSSLTLYCTYAFCFYVGSKFIQDGTTTPAQLFRVFFALMMTAIGVSETSAHGLDVVKAKRRRRLSFLFWIENRRLMPALRAALCWRISKGRLNFSTLDSATRVVPR